MKVSELTGAKLDYWVARSLGYLPDIAKLKPGGDWCAIELREANVARPCSCVDPSESVCAIGTVPNAIKPFQACILGSKVGRGKYPWRQSWFYPSTLWDHGGPIIEQEGIELCHDRAWRDDGTLGRVWDASLGAGWWGGDTLLIAAMRCYVASKFGEEVPDDGVA